MILKNNTHARKPSGGGTQVPQLSSKIGGQM